METIHDILEYVSTEFLIVVLGNPGWDDRDLSTCLHVWHNWILSEHLYWAWYAPHIWSTRTEKCASRFPNISSIIIHAITARKLTTKFEAQGQDGQYQFAREALNLYCQSTAGCMLLSGNIRISNGIGNFNSNMHILTLIYIFSHIFWRWDTWEPSLYRISFVLCISESPSRLHQAVSSNAGMFSIINLKTCKELRSYLAVELDSLFVQL